MLPRARTATLIVALVGCSGGATAPGLDAEHVATDIGGGRVIRLPDGATVTLHTDAGAYDATNADSLKGSDAMDASPHTSTNGHDARADARAHDASTSGSADGAEQGRADSATDAAPKPDTSAPPELNACGGRGELDGQPGTFCGGLIGTCPNGRNCAYDAEWTCAGTTAVYCACCEL